MDALRKAVMRIVQWVEDQGKKMEMIEVLIHVTAQSNTDLITKTIVTGSDDEPDVGPKENYKQN